MKLPYKITQAGAMLYRAGVNYHNFGTITKNGARMFDYFLCDKVSEAQAATIRAFCPDVQFRTSSPQYAPEIKRAAVLFPKIAFYRAKGQA